MLCTLSASASSVGGPESVAPSGWSEKSPLDLGRPFAPAFDCRISYFRQLGNYGVGRTLPTQQQLVARRPGIVGDDLDDCKAALDQQLLAVLIVVNGEQRIALISTEDQLIRECWAHGFRR